MDAEEEMIYRSEFPRRARARVEAERLRAYDALERDVRGIERWRRDAPFIHCVMQVFLAFAQEAREFGKTSNRRAWSDYQLDQRCREFLLSIVIDAWEDKAKYLGISKMFSSSGWGYSINDAARQKMEKSPEWKQYQKLLSEAFTEQADGTAPRIDEPIPPQSVTISKGSGGEGIPPGLEAVAASRALSVSTKAAVAVSHGSADRLVTAMRSQGLNVPRLAEKVRAVLKQRGERKLKVDRATIYRLVEGQTKNPNPLLLNAVYEILQIPAE